jgi:hypothetical protein
MLFTEILAAYSENDINPLYTLYGHNTQLLTLDVGGRYNYHWE